MSREAPNELSQKLGGKDHERKVEREKKLRGGQRNGSEDISSEIDKHDLENGDGAHDQEKQRILGDPRK